MASGCFSLVFKGYVCEDGGVRAAVFAGIGWRTADYPRSRSSAPPFAVQQFQTEEEDY
jgi:hypothetical protein